jgi:hypothetical protein
VRRHKPLRRVVDVVQMPLGQGVHPELGSYTMSELLDVMDCGHYAEAVHLRPPSKTSYVRRHGEVWRKCSECPRVSRGEIEETRRRIEVPPENRGGYTCGEIHPKR